MRKAVIYARVSSEEQAKHGFSIENQKRQCEEFAEKMAIMSLKLLLMRVNPLKILIDQKYKI